MSLPICYKIEKFVNCSIKVTLFPGKPSHSRSVWSIPDLHSVTIHFKWLLRQLFRVPPKTSTAINANFIFHCWLRNGWSNTDFTVEKWLIVDSFFYWSHTNSFRELSAVISSSKIAFPCFRAIKIKLSAAGGAKSCPIRDRARKKSGWIYFDPFGDNIAMLKGFFREKQVIIWV